MVSARISDLLGKANIIPKKQQYLNLANTEEEKEMPDEKIIDTVDINDEDLPPEMLDELSDGKGGDE